MKLKDIREDRDITQRELAEFLHIKQNTYSQYENGQRSLPVDVLIKLADYFSTSTDYILGLTDNKKPYPRKGAKKKSTG
ncbi:MAG: helix-turn-helix transcriptional regulator [Eubacteriaceae bacterium]|nr:helix-turn-helix transcriptional regulator [Eubacteriaceae bacterium]